MSSNPQTPGASQAQQAQLNLSSNNAIIGKEEIIWLAVIGAVVMITLVSVILVLGRCRARRLRGRRRSRGTSIYDGRNDFQAWNKHAVTRPNSVFQSTSAQQIDKQYQINDIEHAAGPQSSNTVKSHAAVLRLSNNAKPHAAVPNGPKKSWCGVRSTWSQMRFSQIGRAL